MRPGRRGAGPTIVWKNKSLKKNQKHEPNIVEITHLYIMHRVHINNDVWFEMTISQEEIKFFFKVQVQQQIINNLLKYSPKHDFWPNHAWLIRW